MTAILEPDERPGPTPYTVGLYPWAEWAEDGRERMAIEGEHFHCTAPAFAQAARSWAARNGWLADVTRRGSKVWFSFRPDPEPAASPAELVARFVDDELIPQAGGWVSYADVLDGYAAWHRLHPDAPRATQRQVLAGVRSTYRLERRGGVAGFAGVQA